jgi:hypothetical protein
MKLLTMQLSPVSCHFLLGPNIHLSSLFFNTLSPCSALNIRDEVPQSNETNGILTGLFINAYVFILQTGIQIMFSSN